MKEDRSKMSPTSEATEAGEIGCKAVILLVLMIAAMIAFMVWADKNWLDMYDEPKFVERNTLDTWWPEEDLEIYIYEDTYCTKLFGCKKEKNQIPAYYFDINYSRRRADVSESITYCSDENYVVIYEIGRDPGFLDSSFIMEYHIYSEDFCEVN